MMHALNPHIFFERRSLYWLGLFFVLCVGVVLPRVVVLGTFPCMDESIFSYWARFTWQSWTLEHTLPHVGGILLYPMLLAPLQGLPGIGLIWLRLADLVLAICAGALLCHILCRECGGRGVGLLLGLIFLLAMNRFEVVEAGVKNPIVAAMIPAFAGIALCQGEVSSTAPRWFVIGGLLAVSVLLRETFVAYALLGFVAIWLGWGSAAAWRYALGGLLVGGCVIALVALGRGGMSPILQHYANLSNMYANESARIMKKLIWNSWYALCVFPQVPVLTIFATWVLGKARNWCHRQSVALPGGKLRGIFWFAVAVIPLVEPFTKPGYIYHFATCLPGCAGLCALSWQRMTRLECLYRLRRPALAMGLCGVMVALLGLFSEPHMSLAQWQMTRDVINDFPKKSIWPQQYEAMSNTLTAGQILREILPHGGTVSTNGHCFFIYDVALAMPPFDMSFAQGNTFLYSDLARSFSVFDKKPETLGKALSANPPEALAIAFTHDDHESTFYEGVSEAVKLTGFYEKVATVPIDEQKDYGWLGYDIYRKK